MKITKKAGFWCCSVGNITFTSVKLSDVMLSAMIVKKSHNMSAKLNQAG